jgi:uncharacterized protein (TIGR01244 family)
MRETPRIAAGSPPAGEVAIGGVKHRILLGQPDAAQLKALRAAGISSVINFRVPAEHAGYDESAAAAAAGVEYCSIPFANGAALTDEMIDASREALRRADEQNQVAALHCRTWNRAGPIWVAYRVLDQGVPLEQAIAEAKAGQMVDPLLEQKARAYIETRQKPGAAAEESWAPVAENELTAEQHAQRERAIAARDRMFGQLFAALSEAMMQRGPDGEPAGPVGAIAVCKEQAPEIAREVGEEQGVRIGRTSERLRNPANAAPAWASSLIVENWVDASGFPSARFAASRDGSFGAVLPIKMAANCLACHGEVEAMQPRVREALAAAYPHDRATGYEEGELRGWFWIQVPK